jgi:hypothetical protein
MDTKKSKTTKAPNEQFTVTGDWSALAKNLKTKFARLTESDLKFEAGKENDLINRIESRLHKTRDEVILLLKNAQMTKSSAL